MNTISNKEYINTILANKDYRRLKALQPAVVSNKNWFGKLFERSPSSEQQFIQGISTLFHRIHTIPENQWDSELASAVSTLVDHLVKEIKTISKSEDRANTYNKLETLAIDALLGGWNNSDMFL